MILARKLVCTALCLEIAFGAAIPRRAWAIQPVGPVTLGQDLNVSTGAEYVSGNYPGAILMPVNLWGSVQRPGIHHIPTQTDLLTLLSVAGGPLADAKLDKITIKRRTGKEEQIIRIDGEDLLSTAGMRSPILEANDIIVIPRERPTIAPNTLNTITFVGSIVSLILAGYAITKIAK